MAIPTVISATGVAARAVQTLTQPFADVLHATLGQAPSGGLESATDDASNERFGPLLSNDPHLSLLNNVLTGQPIEQLDQGITLVDIRTHANSLRDDLGRRIHQALLNAGVEVGSAVRLRINPDDGAVEVLGDHAQRVAIEALFANDPNLGSDFRQLAAINQLLQAADDDRDFAQAYEDNPWQAIFDYRHLFQGKQEAVLQTAVFGGEAKLDFLIGE